MSQKGVQLDQETFSCSICLDLLKDPVTIPCGHSYCMNCIEAHWDGEDGQNSCPQCRKTFTPRPDLVKSTMLANLMEQLKKKKTGLQAAAADHCYAGPEDVACDVCTGKRRRALKSCLVCLVSYCENHLQPHRDVPPLKKHKLVEPSNKLQENICSHHDEVMKIFCRTDQQCICYLCLMDEHKGHDTVSAAAERTERQRELEGSRLNIQQRIQDREKDVKLVQQELETINLCADKTVEDSEKIFKELIRLLEKRSSDVKRQVRFNQNWHVSRFKELQEKLEQEIAELKRKDAELKLLSHTEDHNQFLLIYPSLPPLGESTDWIGIHICPLSYFEGKAAEISGIRDKVQDALWEKWKHTRFEVSLPQPQPQPRTSANAANGQQSVSNGKGKLSKQEQESYFRQQSKLCDWSESRVPSRGSLTGHCYWEVERKVGGFSVAYKNISRAVVSECLFGYNNKSWPITCYNFCYNDVQTPVSGPQSQSD